MILELEGDPDQAVRRGGQQQRAEGTVHGSVGDVEQAVGLGPGGQPLPQGLVVAVVAGRCGPVRAATISGSSVSVRELVRL